eukprot:COSAG06_NODE_6050_length_3134_cov_27.352883_1_plen_132_part_10
MVFQPSDYDPVSGSDGATLRPRLLGIVSSAYKTCHLLPCHLFISASLFFFCHASYHSRIASRCVDPAAVTTRRVFELVRLFELVWFVRLFRLVRLVGCSPDMLEVGRIKVDGKMNYGWNRAHFGAWCVVSAP